MRVYEDGAIVRMTQATLRAEQSASQVSPSQTAIRARFASNQVQPGRLRPSGAPAARVVQLARPSAVPATPAQGSEEPLEAQAPEEAIDDETADEPDLREASSVEEWIKAVVEAKSEPYRIPNDPELHTAEIKYINGEIVAGVNSDFKTVEKIEEALLKAKVKKKDVDALVANAKKAKIEEEKALGKLMKERNLLPGANKKGIKPQATKRKRTKTTRDARTAHTEAINRLLAECAAVQKEAWDLYSDVLEVNLMPAGALFEDKISTADKNHLGDYRTGKDAAHAIPIVWYKAPADYPKLQLADGTIVPPFGDFSLVTRFRCRSGESTQEGLGTQENSPRLGPGQPGRLQ